MARVGRRAGFIVGALCGIAGGMAAGFAVLGRELSRLHRSASLLRVSRLPSSTNTALPPPTPAARPSAPRPSHGSLAGGFASAVSRAPIDHPDAPLVRPDPVCRRLLRDGRALLSSGCSPASSSAAEPLPRCRRQCPKGQSGGRPLAEIVRQPRFIVALVCGIGSFALMSLVMTAAPLAMVACGLGQDTVALGIQWHVLAMFGPSFFTGALIARFGKEAIIAVGLALLAGCAVIALAGIDVLHFWAGADPARSRLELRLHRLDGDADRNLSAGGAEQGSGPQRLDSVRLCRPCVVLLRTLFSSVGWGAINLVVFPVVALCACPGGRCVFWSSSADLVFIFPAKVTYGPGGAA